MSDQTESIILTALLHSQEFNRKTIPHIKPEYFESDTNKTLFKIIQKYQNDYGKVPSFDAIDIELSNTTGLSEKTFQETSDLASKITSEKAAESVHKLSFDWLVEKTEKYCLDRSVYLAIMKSIEVIDGSNKKLTRDAIPEILQKALAVNFDTEIGHDYLENFEQRFEVYHNKEQRIASPLTMLNKVTGGGFPRKTLNVFVAGTNAGKSHLMTYFSSFYLMQGLNVLYITLEMSEIRIAERIDAALFDVTMDDLKKYPKDTFGNKLNKLKQKTHGKLIIKEYPTGSINANNIRFLLDELKTKKDFVPDVIVLDYLNLVGS
jgi:replicative DNA helicase